jgi:hypothetical protein
MKIDCVLTACNLNTLYLEYIPVFIESWSKLLPNVDVRIILIAEEIPEEYVKYSKNITLFKPIKNISDIFISQYIRILYPAILEYKNSVLITDMDMVPLNTNFYVNSIKEVDDDKFVSYRNVLNPQCEICICYNTAIPNVWKEITKINNMEDVIEKLRDVGGNILYENKHGGIGWNTDQRELYEILRAWGRNENKNRYVCFSDETTSFNRLDRSQFSDVDENLSNSIKDGVYSDYHCHRPYSENKTLIDKVVSSIRDNR